MIGARNKKEGMKADVKNGNRAILVEDEKVQRLWTEYFVQLLNVD